jgi:ketosteroid isomerase-like protein
MSENLDLVRSILAAWEQGDFSESAWAHSDIEYVIVDGPSPGAWTGLTGMVEGARTNLDAWRGFKFVADEFDELDGERVLVLVHWVGQGKRSGLELAHMRSTGAQLFHVREAQVTRFIHYWDRDHALADLGLKE